MCDECTELRKRIEALEQRVDQLVEYRGEEETLKTLWIDGEPIGKVADAANERSKEAKHHIENVCNGENAQQGARVGRTVMLPAHRMWADIIDGQDDSLSKGQRRAGTLYGGFLHRASGTDPDEAPILITQIDATGQTYSLSSTHAKELLQQAPQVNFESEVYSMTVKRIFEDVQRFTKKTECECDSIDFCDHGVIQFDSSQGTNVLTANKEQLHEALESVRQAVEGHEVTTSDDSVNPEDGLDEDTPEELVCEATDQLGESDDPSNNVVRRGGDEGVRSSSTDGGQNSR
jgi:hypothetical protein